MIRIERTRTWYLQAMLLAALGAVIGSSLAPTAHAQKQKSNLAANDPEIKKILREREIGDQAQFFDDFFNNDFLPLFASKNPKIHDDLPKVRKLLKIYLTTGKSGPAHDRLNDLTLKKMIAIVKGDYDTAIKFNAVLIIGELNEVDEGTKGKPYAPAYRILKIAVDNPKLPDEVRIAGLIGLERFAISGGIPAADKPAITKSMLALLKQETPPAGRTAEGHTWMRRSAAQILAGLGSPGADDAVVKQFEAIIADSQARPTLRCDVATFLGQLKFPAGSKTDYQALANLVGHQVVDLGKQELDAHTAGNRTLKEEEDLRLRRQLTYILYSALAALQGDDARSGLYAAAAGGDKQEFVGNLRTKIKSAYAALESADSLAPGDVRSSLDELSQVLLPKPERKPDSVVETTPAPQPPAAKPAAPGAQVSGK